MNTFTIDPKNNAFTGITQKFHVKAETYNEAALKAARKMFGRRTTISARRTTGDNNKSGIFNAYLPCKTGGISAHGNNFHVRENQMKDFETLVRETAQAWYDEFGNQAIDSEWLETAYADKAQHDFDAFESAVKARLS